MKKYLNFIKENQLGHDDESEIFTIIKKVQRGQFKVLKYENNKILFQIELLYHTTVPIPSSRKQKIDYIIINNNLEEFKLMQINGKDIRTIDKHNGYIIWTLLTKKIVS